MTTSGRPTVLVVEDEASYVEALSVGLAREGFIVEVAVDGAEALLKFEDVQPDLVLLDVMLPDLDGFEVARRVRLDEGVTAPLPIIFLTARDSTGDKVNGLRLGGDDYIAKPFSVEELIERVKAVLRRSGRHGGDDARLEFADLVLDDDTHEVRRDGELISLTPTEYRLLRYLLANARRVLTRDQILEHVWDYDFTTNSSVLETYISYLRQKVDAGREPLIHTVRGVGYTLKQAATSS